MTCYSNRSNKQGVYYLQDDLQCVCASIEKPCKHSRGHISCPIFMKHGQKLCPNDISIKFETESCWVKNQVKKRKNLVNTVEVTFFAQSSCNFVKLFALMICWLSSKSGSGPLKNMAASGLGSFLYIAIEKPFKHSRSHIFCPIIMKVGQNIGFIDISVKNGEKTWPPVGGAFFSICKQ